ncbi:MAG: HEAT repeat domain-containing protein [Planctomycetota bacterium]
MAQGALDAVAAMGKEVPKELVEPTARLLHDDRTPLRRHAAETLGAIGKAGPNVAITALVKRYPAEQVVEVRAEIAKALGRIGEDGPKLVMDYLLAYAKDPSRVVRQAAAISLTCAAGHRPETTPASLALAGLLEDESADVRRAAAEALGQFSEVAPNVLAALDRASMDSDPQVRTLAAESAATIRASLKQTN